jgi:PUA domain protein
MLSIRRRILRSRDSKKLLQEINSKIPAASSLAEPRNIEEVQIDAITLFFLDGEPLVFRLEGELYPTLRFLKSLEALPQLVVDVGAIPHICNGADVMGPGVKAVKAQFGEGDLVLVVDEKFGKSLAVGISLLDSRSIERRPRGKVVKNIHHVRDRIWEVMKLYG